MHAWTWDLYGKIMQVSEVGAHDLRASQKFAIFLQWNLKTFKNPSRCWNIVTKHFAEWWCFEKGGDGFTSTECWYWDCLQQLDAVLRHWWLMDDRPRLVFNVSVPKLQPSEPLPCSSVTSCSFSSMLYISRAAAMGFSPFFSNASEGGSQQFCCSPYFILRTSWSSWALSVLSFWFYHDPMLEPKLEINICQHLFI